MVWGFPLCTANHLNRKPTLECPTIYGGDVLLSQHFPEPAPETLGRDVIQRPRYRGYGVLHLHQPSHIPWLASAPSLLLGCGCLHCIIYCLINLSSLVLWGSSFASDLCLQLSSPPATTPSKRKATATLTASLRLAAFSSLPCLRWLLERVIISLCVCGAGACPCHADSTGAMP